ncbi:pyridoxal phosphate-dependent aminotransferase [Blautia ammoniilytica]|uniref:Aminotransferase n=1 Tax=Blautia ammoniilytica TaxID=2981782 RepID=A0ABT2TS87_9FIRM|nr:aminotransferase class I/II-fold pyridoxal phosphate-dependent enzyme [Blautia ammoniilytica]MCU6765110.1 aminotransferase class I/II-fold pyridoxal phosphate-dependent enzyme [Blautia ammoniilytica]SCH84632.1 Putative aminotransferase A [uncultured Blautia sp.]
MNEFLSEKVKALKPSGIRKFFDIVKEIPGAISLGVGEPDFETPYHIREAGIQALQAGKTFYTSNSGLMELRKAVSDFTKRRTGLTYDPASEIMLTVGGSEAIDVALRTIINPGDEVIYIQPSYVSYLPCILLADGVPVPIELKAENRFRLTREELEAAITPKTKALILSFPNNPTGAIMEKEDLEAIVDVIKEHHILVISDEIYSELTYGKEHVSIASLPGMKEYSIVINGFSKGFAMTGWRLGYALGNKEILKQMIKIHQYAIMCAPTVSQYAAIEAMYNGDQDVIYMRESYNQRRRFLYHELQRLGLPCFLPEGAFYMFPDIHEFGMTSEDFALDLLKEEKVAVVPGSAFGDCGEGFIRISYAYSIEELKEALLRIERYLNRKRSQKTESPKQV